MPRSYNTGWTAASLLPSIAAGFSPGASVATRLAPAQVHGNPKSLKAASSIPNFHQELIRRILGVKPTTPQPMKTPGINPAVNNLTTKF